MFRPPNAPYGQDLLSTDIMRGRDHGLPRYNEVRHACGLIKAIHFSDFADVMSEEVTIIGVTQLRQPHVPLFWNLSHRDICIEKSI